MALEFLRDWARARVSILPPNVVRVEGVSNLGPGHLAGQLAMPLLSPPRITPPHDLQLKTQTTVDFAYLRSEVFPVDMSLGHHESRIVSIEVPSFDLPEIHQPEGLRLFGFPGIANVFDDPLGMPRRAGKAYRSKAHLQALSGEEPSDFLESDDTLCRHGISKNACEHCRQERQKQRQATTHSHRARRIPTVNVFDLLLPYLQPPIERLLAEPLLFPPGRRPYDFQIQGIRFLTEREAALLGDDMGLGKTIQTIVALQWLFRRGEVRSVLILCKRSLLGNWEKELRKWAPELYVIKIRGQPGDREMLWRAPASVYLATYETLRQDVDGLGTLVSKFNAVVLDEAQEIKNPSTRKARAVRRVPAKYRWGLSGTPLENKIEDVVAIFDYLKPSLFSGRSLLAGTSQRNSDYLSADYVKRSIEPFFLRRRIAQVMPDLPEKVVNEIWLDLTEEQQAAYDDAYREAQEQLRGPGATRVHAFALVSRLKQICNMEPQSQSSCKADYLEDELESVTASGHKALVYSHFPNVTLRQLVERIEGFSPAQFDGSLSDRQRESLIERFQEREEPRVLLTSVKAGGVGLNLTRANHVFHFDHWWNPAIARQAEGRAHRIGQHETVFVYDIYTNQTIEERIHDLLAAKQQLFDDVIDDLTSDYVQGKITDEEIFALFELDVPEALRKESRPGGTATETPRRTIDLDSLTPTEFEHLVAEIYKRMGFAVQMTSQSWDEGIDVLARRPTDIGVDHLIIQCKHYPAGSVGEPVVREMMGTRQSHREATHAVIVTSGKFSNGAIRLAEKFQITLVDGPQLSVWLKSHGLT